LCKIVLCVDALYSYRSEYWVPIRFAANCTLILTENRKSVNRPLRTDASWPNVLIKIVTHTDTCYSIPAQVMLKFPCILKNLPIFDLTSVSRPTVNHIIQRNVEFCLRSTCLSGLGPLTSFISGTQ
jgi:hypothetical protein